MISDRITPTFRFVSYGTRFEAEKDTVDTILKFSQS
jgi:hypothetical protein